MPEKSIEEIIRRAMLAGKFDDLPGKGKPLQLDQNPHEDPEWRTAYHVLKSGGFSLPWIESLNEIETDLQDARRALNQVWKWRTADHMEGKDPQVMESEWVRADKIFRERIRDINEGIRAYNLAVPNAQFQLQLLDADQEIKKITDSP